MRRLVGGRGSGRLVWRDGGPLRGRLAALPTDTFGPALSFRPNPTDCRVLCPGQIDHVGDPAAVMDAPHVRPLRIGADHQAGEPITNRQSPFAHAAPPQANERRTKSPADSPVFGAVLRFLVPFRSPIAANGFPTNPLESSISSVFSRLLGATVK